MREKSWILVFSLACLIGLSSCRTKVERIGVDDVRDVSGNWNDSDSRFVSEEMIKDCLSRAWLSEFNDAKGRKPVVIVGEVRNRSMEHINTQTFTKDLERALTNSGKIRFVANQEEREQIREERGDQATHSRGETRSAPGLEKGADFMLSGQVNMIVDEKKNRKVAYYQTELELISMANNEKVWIGQKKIKKYVKRASAKR